MLPSITLLYALSETGLKTGFLTFDEASSVHANAHAVFKASDASFMAKADNAEIGKTVATEATCNTVGGLTHRNTYQDNFSTCAGEATCICGINADSSVKVYTVDGKQMNSDVKSLPAGMYIVNDKKVIIKK